MGIFGRIGFRVNSTVASKFDMTQSELFTHFSFTVFRNFLEKNTSVPMVVSSVISNPASEAVAMGIAGLEFSYQKLNDIFFTLVNSCDSSDCLKCGEPGVQCFLTNTAGQIILSTAGEKAVSLGSTEILHYIF